MASETNTHETLAQNTLLLGEKDYAQAIQIVLGSATQQLIIFDQDLKHGDFASLKTAALIQGFLSKSTTSTLTIVLQDTAYFEHFCPRLYRLLQTYSHRMTVFETNQTVKHAKDCFVVADSTHFVKRIHIDQSRFKYALNDAVTCEQLRQRFDELLDATHHPLAVTQLGL